MFNSATFQLLKYRVLCSSLQSCGHSSASNPMRRWFNFYDKFWFVKCPETLGNLMKGVFLISRKPDLAFKFLENPFNFDSAKITQFLEIIVVKKEKKIFENRKWLFVKVEYPCIYSISSHSNVSFVQKFICWHNFMDLSRNFSFEIHIINNYQALILIYLSTSLFTVTLCRSVHTCVWEHLRWLQERDAFASGSHCWKHAVTQVMQHRL